MFAKAFVHRTRIFQKMTENRMGGSKGSKPKAENGLHSSYGIKGNVFVFTVDLLPVELKMNLMEPLKHNNLNKMHFLLTEKKRKQSRGSQCFDPVNSDPFEGYLY